MLYTIIQIIAIQALFLLVYDLFLKRETFFNYNRAYLLITSVLSLVLPFIKFSELKTITTKDLVIQLPEVFIGTKVPTANEIFIAEQAGIIIEQPQMPFWQSIALIGITVALFIFLLKITKLYWLKHQNPKRWKGNVLIVELIKSSAAFSFFNTIFLGEQISEAEKPVIYKHELVHIKELHTLDLLFFEILRIIFWFNPLVYIYQNRIKELHEYIADAKAVKQNGKASYYESLLNQVFDVNNVSFTNTFFKKSLIKKRIAMLQKSKSKQLHLIKYALLIPMILGMLIYTSTEVRAQQKVKQESVVDQELTDEELIKKYYDEFVSMKKNGATFFEIAEASGMSKLDSEKYITPRKEYLKFKAYMQYIADGIIERKSEKGTLTQADFDTAKLMRLGRHDSYKDYKAWKFSDEGKKHWESITRDGILRLFVKEIGNHSVEEKIRLDGLLKQLESDNNFEKIILTDGKSRFIIDSYKSPNSDQKVIESIEVPFSIIDEVPTLVECKDLTTNKERKNCMNQFVNRHVNKNFNTSIADSLNPGRKRIFVAFKIDTEGKIKDIKARGPNVELEEEAIRVIKTLPQFIPGRQKGELVTVPYSLPIVFQVADDNRDQVTKTHKELVVQRDRILQNSNEKNPVVIQLNKQIDDLKKEKFVRDEVEKLTKYLKDEIDRTESTWNDSTTTSRTKKYKAFLKQIQKDSTNLKEIPFSVVEVSPVYENCKTLIGDKEQRKCTINAINKHVNKNFNTNLAKELGITGKQQIFVAFTINKEGNITDVKARASREELKAEAIRVINALPQFIPGKHDGETIDVPFSLPIYFQVGNIKKD
ncbi:M56 family metallopeptidase [Winogradskyella sp.]|uniref:M56 family metallopeptidase n=1 Tax=Winogradskyella sp. TaxID=1883156 RepID=UPI0025FE93E3|nr:M56 family metallopeptidase [Winogradskyella sp.]